MIVGVDQTIIIDSIMPKILRYPHFIAIEGVYIVCLHWEAEIDVPTIDCFTLGCCIRPILSITFQSPGTEILKCEYAPDKKLLIAN